MIFEVHQQVAGLLRHPLPRRASGDPGQVHAAGAVLDEKGDVQSAQEHGVDVEEIRCQDRLRLGIQERPPGLPGPPGRGIDARILENLPHRGRRELVPQASHLAVNAPVAPARIVPRHLKHQCPQGRRSPGPARYPARVDPVPPDEVSVPAQQGARGYDQAQLAEWLPGISRASAASTARSAQDNRGALTWRWSTAT